ncbi:hypothetical protein E4U57_003226 [Claviceps arundinis]|uniref:OTU domain-containing protein n=1 Tax=Claviceps arundinis TaxID=1623583 RepID=A0ABQ7P786_9HYPO|nr:hypothetical protein E4U57_003226 [Claviceps arundinis]
MEPESLTDMQARHRRELNDLQGRITSKKKNATKKTRRGVNDECAQMQRTLREKQDGEVAGLQSESANADSDANQQQEDDSEAQHEDRDPTGTGSNHTTRTTELDSKMTKLDIQDSQQQQQQHQKQQQPSSSSHTLPEKPPSPQSQSQSQEQRPRKRNRQKDRLARRAAEQAALAEQASAEASSMTDHRALERTSLTKIFEEHGLVEREIAPDGHCLFAAVADQLLVRGVVADLGGSGGGGGGGGSTKDPPYRIVRRAAAKYMAEHGEQFEGFLEEDLGVYVARVRDTAEWGGHLDLMALAGGYGVEIRVVQEGGRIERIRLGEGEKEKERKILWLAYYRHGYGLGEHYNSLRTKG